MNVLFFITLLVVSCTCMILENENIARGRLSYQSMEKDQTNRATQANYLLPNGLTETYNNLRANQLDWWSIDLGHKYNIEEICMWNCKGQSYSKDFKVFAGEFPDDEQSTCIDGNFEVIYEATFSPVSYKCKTCSCTGSYVSIKTKGHVFRFSACDIKIKGTIVQNSENEIFNLSSSNFYYGQYINSPQPSALQDLNFATYIETFYHNPSLIKPFIRLDLLATRQVQTIIIQTYKSTGRYMFQDVRITIFKVPETFQSPPQSSMIAHIRDSSSDNYNYYPTYVGYSPQYISGRFVLIKAETGGNPIMTLRISHLSIHVKKLNDTNINSKCIEKKNQFISVHKDNIQLTNILNDGIYFSDGTTDNIAFGPSQPISITTQTIFSNTICLTSKTFYLFIDKLSVFKFKSGLSLFFFSFCKWY
ncbi:DgyrCDS13670 [Dimorphilus gyrociliatus]|uniref:DgyrCDS13670 n=1 Tax=Dimorphilus gyrociliatus TaxID=2664684 RepID=A0A7I8WBD3_9ANNE|nr:DgyrCDS13670 [Dimorphilus gyrociliatus]